MIDLVKMLHNFRILILEGKKEEKQKEEKQEKTIIKHYETKKLFIY